MSETFKETNETNEDGLENDFYGFNESIADTYNRELKEKAEAEHSSDVDAA